MDRDCAWITYASCELEEAQNRLPGFCLPCWYLLGPPLRRGHPFTLKAEGASNIPMGRSSVCCGHGHKAGASKGESGIVCKGQRRQGPDKSRYFITTTVEAIGSFKVGVQQNLIYIFKKITWWVCRGKKGLHGAKNEHRE